MLYSSKKTPISQIILIITTIIIIIILSLIILFNIRIYKINGTSMSPTLMEDEYVLSYRTQYKRGDIIAFHHKDVVMIKRLIGLPKDKIDIDDDGTVYVNDKPLEEQYLSSKSLGKPEIDFPYIVPENRYFVLGDNRADSIDSRNIYLGSIAETEVIGKVKISLIPLKLLS